MHNKYLCPLDSYACLLRKYRKRAGLTQQELAKKAGVSARTISDIERGIILNSHKDNVYALADELALSGPERGIFIQAARKEAVRERQSRPERVQSSGRSWSTCPNIPVQIYPSYLDGLEIDVVFMQKARESGNWKLTLDMAHQKAHFLREWASQNQSSTWERAYLHKILAQVLLEQAKVHVISALPSEVRAKMLPIATEFQGLAKMYKHDRRLYTQFYSLEHFVLNSIYHIEEDHEQAIKCYRKIELDAVSPCVRIEALRGAAVSYGFLEKKGQFKGEFEGEFNKTELQLRQIIDSGQCADLGYLCFVCDGLARAYTLLERPKEAFLIIERGWDFHTIMENSQEKKPLRTTQLCRSELIVVKHFQPEDVGRVRQIRLRALTLANEYTYPRHLNQIMA
jgi:transcriptional regulator with XRE-family HTH domain